MTGAPLVGREKELEVLADLTKRAGAGATGIVVIEGPAGLGKSALVAQLRRTTDERGLRTWFARGERSQRGTPLAALRGALGERTDPVVAAEIPPPSPFSAHGTRTTAPLVNEVVESVINETTAPTLLIADDLHWADETSLLVVARLAARQDEHPVSMVVTVRTPTANATCLRAVDELLATPGSRRIVLELLAASGRAELCEVLLGAPPGPRLERLVTRTGGNPLFITQLLRSLQDEARLERQRGLVEVTSDDVPEDLAAAIVRRVDQLSEPARVAVRLGAVSGSPVEPSRLAALCGQTVAELAAPVSEAIQAGVLVDDGELRFVHQLVEEAVYEDVPPTVRAELHRELASALRADGEGRARVAHHDARGLIRGDTDTAETVEAAARIAAVDDPYAALDLLDHLRAALTAAADRDRVDALRAGPLAWTGQIDEAVAVVEHLVDAGVDLDADEQTRLRILLASLRVAQNRPVEAVDVLETALEDASAVHRTRVLAELALARLHTSDGPGAEEAATQALTGTEEGLDAGAGVVSGSVISRVRATRHRYRESVRFAREAADRADRAGTAAAHRFVPWLFVGLAHLDLDESAGVEEALRVGRDRGNRHATGWPDPLYDGLACSLAFRAGRLDDAEAAAQASVSVARATGAVQAIVWALAVQALIATLRDDLDGAETLVAEGERELSSGQMMLGIDFLFLARARLEEARGDAERALEVLLLAWEVFGDAGAHNCRPLLAPDLVRLAFQERDQPTVAAVLAEVERADREGDLPLSAALVPWCRGLAARDSAALADAEEALIELDRPLDVEAVRSDRAVCLAAGGRTGEARRLRDEFLGSVDDLGMAGMRRHLLRRLEPFGLGRPRAERAARPVSGWESLTPSEQAIVDLVAQGLSNREIGEERGCSARTVETHLGRTYRKLGVTNRTQLAVEVAERAAGSG